MWGRRVSRGGFSTGEARLIENLGCVTGISRKPVQTPRKRIKTSARRPTGASLPLSAYPFEPGWRAGRTQTVARAPASAVWHLSATPKDSPSACRGAGVGGTAAGLSTVEPKGWGERRGAWLEARRVIRRSVGRLQWFSTPQLWESAGRTAATPRHPGDAWPGRL